MRLENPLSADDLVIDLAREADFQLGFMHVSPPAREVLRDGKRELLEPRVMQVLVALYRAQGAVVSRDALIARCWAGRIVGEDAINRAIWRLRKLADSDEDFIVETIARVGYRLRAGRVATDLAEGGSVVISPAVEGEEGAAPDDLATKIPLRRRWKLVTSLSLALAALALGAWLLWPVAPPSRISVAVLPFVNLSGDTTQEYFSDGITEEITSALAKIPGLPVVGRTSAFQYKGKAADLRAIGRALNASYVLEGSVRKASDRVRITAQLVSAKTGDHIWADSYDRQLKDIFVVQEDVAQAIAEALRVPLGLKQGEKLISDRTHDTESYQDYLRARALFHAREMGQVVPILERVVARDPGYAPAWALLARTYILAPGYQSSIYYGSAEQSSIRVASFAQKGVNAARQALRLDPGNAAAHAALAQLAIYQNDWETGRNEFNQALALDPNDPDTLVQYSSALLGLLGYVKQEFVVLQRLRSIEPFVPVYNREYANTLLNLGRTNEAIDILMHTPRDGTQGSRNRGLAFALSSVGRFNEAADVLLAPNSDPQLPRAEAQNAARLLRTAPNSVSRPQALPNLIGLNFVYLFVGAPGRAMEAPERELAIKGATRPFSTRVWSPPFAPVRKTERFKTFVQKAGMAITGARMVGRIFAILWGATISHVNRAVRLWRKAGIARRLLGAKRILLQPALQPVLFLLKQLSHPGYRHCQTAWRRHLHAL